MAAFRQRLHWDDHPEMALLEINRWMVYFMGNPMDIIRKIDEHWGSPLV
jgi:hypothetical protein